MEMENYQEGELTNTSESMLAILETRKTLLYCLHTLLDQFELHLDNITKRYKGMTVTWLLGSGASVGFIFSSELQGFQINKIVAASLILLFSLVGVFSIWILDVLVFHKFWGAFFLEEIKMEKEYPFLIDIGDTAASLDNVRARIFGSGGFYMAINVVLILAAGGTATFLFKDYWIKAFVISITVFVAYILAKTMKHFCEKLCQSLDNLRNKQD